jgi:putative membrane protein
MSSLCVQRIVRLMFALEPRPIGNWLHGRLPLALLLIVLTMMLVLGVAPPSGHTNYLLEVTPALLYALGLAIVYRYLPFSHLVYVVAFVQCCMMTYGGVHTFAEAPFGNWLRDTLGLLRNPWDRIGHLALGLSAFHIREVLLRVARVPHGFWLFWLVVAVATTFGALWEIFEWWTTLVFAPDIGSAFLGSQGDEWDAQWDMLLACVGAFVSQFIGSRAHDRSMLRMREACMPQT